MSENALVVLAIGQPCLTNWNQYCSANWQAYSARHRLDLIVISEPLADSPRPISWQKCLILGQPFAANYRQLALLDADIAVNPAAPNIFEQVPIDRVGGVVSGSHIHKDLQPVLLARLSKKPVDYDDRHAAWQRDQSHFYETAGLSPRPEGIIQAGVLVASPQYHAELFRTVFDSPHHETRQYEQVPLSHAVFSAGLFHPLDTRFNSVLYETLLVHHYHLFGQPIDPQIARVIVRAELVNNFFLHFVYDQSLVRFLP